MSLGPLGLIIVWHFLKKCGNATMPQCPGLVGKLVATVKTNNKHFTFIVTCCFGITYFMK